MHYHIFDYDANVTLVQLQLINKYGHSSTKHGQSRHCTPEQMLRQFVHCYAKYPTSTWLVSDVATAMTLNDSVDIQFNRSMVKLVLPNFNDSSKTYLLDSELLARIETKLRRDAILRIGTGVRSKFWPLTHTLDVEKMPKALALYADAANGKNVKMLDYGAYIK